MIQKVYEINPLLCSFCGGEIKILSFIIKSKTIKTILAAMDLPSQKPEPLAHSPPLFQGHDLRTSLNRQRNVKARVAERHRSI